jgi:hypothetical protein
LDELLSAVPALLVDGAKGVGKTATASRRAGTLHELDEPQQRALAEADPRRVAQGKPPVVVDELQRVADSWDVVRRAVDADRTPGRFLLTGSASRAQPPAHSGGGRIVTVRMRPFSLAERGLAEPTVSLTDLFTGEAEITGETTVGLEAYVDEVVRSGLPGIRSIEHDRALRVELNGYLDRVAERDFTELGHSVRRPELLRRWLRAYAAATATTASFEAIRDAAATGVTARRRTRRPSPTATYCRACASSMKYLRGCRPALNWRGCASDPSTTWSTRRSPPGCSTSVWMGCLRGGAPRRRGRVTGCWWARCSSRWSLRASACTRSTARRACIIFARRAVSARWT